MIKKIDHIAIAVRNLEEALHLYDKVFGIKPNKIKVIPEQGVKAALLPVGESCEIELLGTYRRTGGRRQILRKPWRGDSPYLPGSR